jgi:hypothetical protein
VAHEYHSKNGETVTNLVNGTRERQISQKEPEGIGQLQ